MHPDEAKVKRIEQLYKQAGFSLAAEVLFKTKWKMNLDRVIEHMENYVRTGQCIEVKLELVGDRK